MRVSFRSASQVPEDGGPKAADSEAQIIGMPNARVDPRLSHLPTNDPGGLHVNADQEKGQHSDAEAAGAYLPAQELEEPAGGDRRVGQGRTPPSRP